MSTIVEEKNVTTADLAAAAQTSPARREVNRNPADENKNAAVQNTDKLDPLFLPDVAKDFRSRWDALQTSFVDDPRQAVRQGDELVAQVMTSLAQSFSNERTKLESQLDRTDKESTENLRLALRRYRSFFERLLSL